MSIFGKIMSAIFGTKADASPPGHDFGRRLARKRWFGPIGNTRGADSER